jgi:hypothetical protein
MPAGVLPPLMAIADQCRERPKSVAVGSVNVQWFATWYEDVVKGCYMVSTATGIVRPCNGLGGWLRTRFTIVGAAYRRKRGYQHYVQCFQVYHAGQMNR